MSATVFHFAWRPVPQAILAVSPMMREQLAGLGISRATLQTIVGSRHDLQCCRS